MPRIVGYARVSTTKQEAEGLSLETQERRLREAGAGEVLVDVMSGAKDSRPQFQALLRMVQAREVDQVVVCKLDRLTRSITARAEIYKAFTEPGAPVLRALDDGIDLSTASGRQVFDLLGALATGERERIRERIMDGLAERASRGQLVGQCPWGLRLTKTGAGVEINPEEEEQVRAVLRIFGETRGLGTAVRRIAKELGIKKGPSVWRTWLLSPQLAGGIPRGCKHQFRRVYDSITYNAFPSYLTLEEQEQLIARYSGPEAPGPRPTYSHPTRQRGFCGNCGKSLQRRNDRTGRPRWLHCVDAHCDWRARTVPIPQAMEVLTRASFHFCRQRLEAAVVAQQASQLTSQPSARELELQSTLAKLRGLPSDIVGDAIAKAERELVDIQSRALARRGVDAVNLREAVELLEWVAGLDLEELGEEGRDRLGRLFQVAGVSVITGESPDQVHRGHKRMVLVKAQAEGLEPVAVGELPAMPGRGGSFAWRDLAAALRVVA